MTASSNEIRMNFLDDYGEMARLALTAAGYTPDATASADELLLQYLNVLHRRVEVRKRKSHKAPDFQCPRDHELGLKALLEKSERGDDLRPHQSRKIVKADYDDAMLNDWGIHHFHLGTTPDPKRPELIQGTRPVLYAMVTKDDLYCISVMDHGQWSNQQLLEAVHTHWPHLIDGARIKGAIGLARTHSDDEISTLRKAGINVITQRKDGTIHAPPGGGSAADQTSVRVSMARNTIVRMCRDLEKLVRDRVEKLAAQGKVQPPFDLHLKEIDGRRCVSDSKSDLTFEVNYSPLKAL